MRDYFWKWCRFVIIGALIIGGITIVAFSKKPTSYASRGNLPRATWQIAAPVPGYVEGIASNPALCVSEVYLGEGGPSQASLWVELFCGHGPVVLADYSLSDLDGLDRTLPAGITLQSGDYVVIKFGAGQTETDEVADIDGSGIREVYLGGRSQARLSGSESRDRAPSRILDQIALIDVAHGGRIIDGFSWCPPGKQPQEWEGEDIARLIAEGAWNGSAIEQTNLPQASWSRRLLAQNGKLLTGPTAWGLTAKPSPGGFLTAEATCRKGDLVLTEIGFSSDRGPAYAELLCKRGPVDLSQFSITDLDGNPVPLSEQPMQLKTGEYASITWQISGSSEADVWGDANHNGVREIFLSPTTAPARTCDQLALLYGGEIHDAIAWKRVGEAIIEYEAKDIADLQARGAWQSQLIELGGPETLLARDASEKWIVSALPTPGMPNRFVHCPADGIVRISEVQPQDADGASWAELEISDKASAQGIDISLLALTDLDGTGSILSRDPVTVLPGSRVLVSWSQDADDLRKSETDKVGDINGNGIREIVIFGLPPASTEDELALCWGAKIIDALAWCNGDGKVSEEEDADFAMLRANKLIPGKHGEDKLLVRPASDASSGKIAYSIARLGAALVADPDPTPGRANDFYLKRPFGRVSITAMNIGRDEMWVEVTVKSGPSDISRMIVSDLDGADLAISESPIMLRRGETARIHWGVGVTEDDRIGDKNTNGVRDVWIDQEKPTRSQDEIVLIHRGRFIDGQVYGQEERAVFSYDELKDLKRLQATGIWRGKIEGRAASPLIVTDGDAVNLARR